jgi:hypothetical protein
MSLKGLIDSKEEKDRESSVLSVSSSSAKRARLDYVATRPAALAARGGMGKTRPHKPANWLRGGNCSLGQGVIGGRAPPGTDRELRKETLVGEELGGQHRCAEEPTEDDGDVRSLACTTSG